MKKSKCKKPDTIKSLRFQLSKLSREIERGAQAWNVSCQMIRKEFETKLDKSEMELRRSNTQLEALKLAQASFDKFHESDRVFWQRDMKEDKDFFQKALDTCTIQARALQRENEQLQDQVRVLKEELARERAGVAK